MPSLKLFIDLLRTYISTFWTYNSKSSVKSKLQGLWGKEHTFSNQTSLFCSFPRLLQWSNGRDLICPITDEIENTVKWHGATPHEIQYVGECQTAEERFSARVIRVTTL